MTIIKNQAAGVRERKGLVAGRHLASRIHWRHGIRQDGITRRGYMVQSPADRGDSEARIRLRHACGAPPPSECIGDQWQHGDIGIQRHPDHADATNVQFGSGKRQSLRGICSLRCPALSRHASWAAPHFSD